MRLRDVRGLLEISMAVLCLWAAAYHTPAGALVRGAWAWVADGRSATPSLLSYFGGLEPEVVVAWTEMPPPSPPPTSGEDDPVRLPLGYGVHAALLHLAPDHREPARAVARRLGRDPRLLDDPGAGPREAARLLDALARRGFSTDDAAVVALLCGEEPARYALERSRAEGRTPELDVLARALPPRFEAQVVQAGRALALGVVYGLSWPVPEGAGISSPFGMRRHPLLGDTRLHTGVDIPLPVGTPVRASAAGVVRRASEDALNGKVLVIDHGHGVTTAYCHNSLLRVSAGQRVERGQEISLSGNTGRSTGPHLHYQLELSGKPVDPLRYRSVNPQLARRPRP